MIALLLLAACTSTPTYSVPTASHAVPLEPDTLVDGMGLPLLVVDDEATVWRGERVRADELASVLANDPVRGGILVAAAPDTPWSRTQTALDALNPRVQTAYLLVEDPRPAPVRPRGERRSNGLLRWEDGYLTQRVAGNNDALISATATRSQLMAGSHAGVHLVVGSGRSTADVTELLDGIVGHGVSCVSTGVDDLPASDTSGLGGTARIGHPLAVLPLELARPCASAEAQPLTPAEPLRTRRIDSEGGLSAEQLDSVVLHSDLVGCVGEGAHLQLDIGTDGQIVGGIATGYATRPALRDRIESCLLRRAHQLSFPSAERPSRALYSLAPASNAD